MSDTAVSLLTPPGTGAIATVEVRGPRAYSLAKQLFKPTGKPLPEPPEEYRFWFGTLGADEVVLAVTAADAVEVHCHGGRRVVRWVIEQFLANGCVEDRTPLGPPRVPRLTCYRSLGWTREQGEGFELLQRAPTLRTASILLDQLNGAFANEVRAIVAELETAPVAAMRRLDALKSRYRSIGEYLVEPWRVVFAGPPNAGKSSLVNALAGYQRSVVSDVAGTTRDAVSVCVAFDGWPMELIDTAGLREAEGLEAEGIGLARDSIRTAHALVWVVDATDPNARLPYLWDCSPRDGLVILAANKCDLVPNFDRETFRHPDAEEVPVVATSAATGGGLSELVAAFLSVFPRPAPGIAVPYNRHLYELLSAASDAARASSFTDRTETNRLLREALAASE